MALAGNENMTKFCSVVGNFVDLSGFLSLYLKLQYDLEQYFRFLKSN